MACEADGTGADDIRIENREGGTYITLPTGFGRQWWLLLGMVPLSAVPLGFFAVGLYLLAKESHAEGRVFFVAFTAGAALFSTMLSAVIIPYWATIFRQVEIRVAEGHLEIAGATACRRKIQCPFDQLRAILEDCLGF